ncbi:G2-specific kinase fin1 [Lecanosticta acicola]|uniref:non-specific serine/threonine protein kinase n=1 Tax=Lecanosticta acicola TaxID=111012 RepID=A0AAI8Z4H4_9PEZI|nr:G2-specific kinase fin1 [Lecanosticta acicola]
MASPDPETNFVEHELIVRRFNRGTLSERQQRREELVQEYQRMSIVQRDRLVKAIYDVREAQKRVIRAMNDALDFWHDQSMSDQIRGDRMPMDEDMEKALGLQDGWRREAVNLQGGLDILRIAYTHHDFPETCIDWVQARYEEMGDVITDAEERVEMIEASLREDAAIQQFIDESLDEELFDGDWQGAVDLGGGISEAGLWVKIDEDGNVVDRIVFKREFVDITRWNTSSNVWHGNPQDPHNRTPLEYFLQNKCNAASPEHFVKLRNWSQDMEKHALNLYVEYCAGGDLRGVEKKYVSNKNLRIPEPFLWMLFLHLTESCLVMWRGGIERNHPDWDKQIVHMDIKPANIFLASADEKKSFPHYPTPKLADFGLAFETSPNDANNPVDHRFAGTTPYMAPEQHGYTKWQLLDHTNVYAIGATIFGLFHHRNRRLHPEQQISAEDPDTKWKFSTWSSLMYSSELRGLIEQCIDWDPSLRPSSLELRERILSAIATLRDEKGEYVRDGLRGEQPAISNFDLVLAREMYPLGFAIDSGDVAADGELVAGTAGAGAEDSSGMSLGMVARSEDEEDTNMSGMD